MRRLVLTGYGTPPSLQWQDAERQEPGPGEVRVRTEAAGLNPIDRKIARGELASMMPTPLPAQIASDLAGVIDALGDGVTGLQVGDAVFGMVNGSLSESVIAPSDALVARPAGVPSPQPPSRRWWGSPRPRSCEAWTTGFPQARKPS